MNKLSLIAVAVAALSAGTAMAQSSVTVYGRLNTTVERQKDIGVVGSKYTVSNNASRIGFKGTEDLGGGMKAGFQIEHGFESDTGAASGGAAGFWARQSEVNLGGGFGMVRLGTFTSEAYFATSDVTDLINHGTGNASDALYAYLGQNTNKVAYRTPDLSGLTAELAVALSETSRRGKQYDLAVNYAAGPFGAGFGYEKVTNGSQFAIRANYETGPLLVTGYIQRAKYNAPTFFPTGSQTILRLSGQYTIGAGELHLALGSAGKIGSVANTGAKQVTVGYNYNLSKRTKVYGFYTSVNNDSAATYGGAAAAGRDPSSVAVGIRHNF